MSALGGERTPPIRNVGSARTRVRCSDCSQLLVDIAERFDAARRSRRSQAARGRAARNSGIINIVNIVGSMKECISTSRAAHRAENAWVAPARTQALSVTHQTAIRPRPASDHCGSVASQAEVTNSRWTKRRRPKAARACGSRAKLRRVLHETISLASASMRVEA